MSVCKRLRDLLDAQHVRYVLISHSLAFTAQEVAARMHVPGREMAKTVVVKRPAGLALVVLRAPDKVDLERVGENARLATEQEFQSAFPDCELGAMPPFGSLYDVPTLVDEELARDEEIVFNAGSHVDAIRLAFADFARLVKPTIGRYSTCHTLPVG